MIRAVIDCDGCRQRDAAEAQLLYVTLPETFQELTAHCSPLSVEREPSSTESGERRAVSSAPRLQRVDLCPKCLAAALARFVNRLPPEERRDWVRQFGVGETPG
jgi:hypothetical protein